MSLSWIIGPAVALALGTVGGKIFGPRIVRTIGWPGLYACGGFVGALVWYWLQHGGP